MARLTAGRALVVGAVVAAVAGVGIATVLDAPDDGDCSASSAGERSAKDVVLVVGDGLRVWARPPGWSPPRP